MSRYFEEQADYLIGDAKRARKRAYKAVLAATDANSASSDDVTSLELARLALIHARYAELEIEVRRFVTDHRLRQPRQEGQVTQ